MSKGKIVHGPKKKDRKNESPGTFIRAQKVVENNEHKDGNRHGARHLLEADHLFKKKKKKREKKGKKKMKMMMRTEKM
jgi:hypothetical protein